MAKLLQKFTDLVKISFLCHKLTPFWSLSYLSAIRKAIRLCDKENFSPEEAFALGLINPKSSNNEFKKFISRRKLTKVQESVNPASWQSLLKDKGIFYRYCMTNNIPIPSLYAIFFKSTAGWSHDGFNLFSKDDWINFFENHLPAEFVIKPSNGAGGKNFNIFKKQGTEFSNTFGNKYKSWELYELLKSGSNYESFVIQQRLRSHPEITALTGIDFLQTVRFITFIDKDNHCQIMLAYLKPIVNENAIIDNFQLGRTGNVESRVSLDTGITENAKQISGDGSGIKLLLSHPITKLKFESFKLPLWEQTCTLVKETAIKFLPVRTIGWDVAITQNGPFIIEGNIWWDPPNEHMCMDEIVKNILTASMQN